MQEMTTYFLKHPVVALVLNAMLCLVGLLCFQNLSVREYPDVNFPKVYVYTYYANASAEMIESTVTNPLEDQLAGIEGLETITSESKNEASYISLTFKNGTPIDRALLSIREAIGLVRLPNKSEPPVIERKKASDGMPFMIISLESDLMDFASLTHYTKLNLKNALRGVQGVASVETWGQPYTYTILLDRHKMYNFGVNADDVFDALDAGATALPVGKFQNEIAVTLNSQLKTQDDYENLIIREQDISDPKNKKPAVLLKHVATVKLETDDRLSRVRINGKPGLCLGIQKTSDANPLDVSNGVQNQLKTMEKNLPEHVRLNLIHDGAQFVRYALKNVQSSIIEALVFVLLVVFFFLRNMRATLVPLLTIPISLVGACLFLKIFGFSINILTLLAMVLAIGLVVDDAIIVLENSQRHMEKGLSTFDAALKGAKEISFSIVAMTLTLTCVYAPLAFISGVVGKLFIEFAVALAGSVLISGVVALTLSPLMCARTLQNNQGHLWPQIDVWLHKLTQKYAHTLLKVFLYKKTCAASLLLCLLGIIFLTQILPSETAPKEDRGLVGVYLPPILGKDINTMDEKIRFVETKVGTIPEAKHTLVFMGTWGGNVLFPLHPQSLRSRSAQQIIDSLKPIVDTIPSIDTQVWSWDSALPGNDGSINSGELSLIISSPDTYEDMFKTVERIRTFLDQEKYFDSVCHDLKLDTPAYRVDLDTYEMGRLNLTHKQIAKTIEIFFSGNQTLTFMKDGLSYAITLKGKESPWSLAELYVTNKMGKKICLGAVAKLVATSGPQNLYHYNQMRSVMLNANLPKGKKLGAEMDGFLHKVKSHLPFTYKTNWEGAARSYEESKALMLTLFFLAIIFIFAILSAQFENFFDPAIILLTVPLASLGALFLVWACEGALNIYTQIGLVTLVGLITKHGILIVAFTNDLCKEMPLANALVQACSLRLRPILMTTSAMVFGAIPLVLSQDAGHEAQRAMGIVLVGGLTFGTALTLFVLPTIYLMLKREKTP
jgi:multidrug efflux pump